MFLRKLPVLTLIRLAYISRSTESNRETRHVQAVADKILAVANVYNKENGITGVLCFSNDCYFQCLEGNSSAAKHLYSKLLNDPRHRDLKIVLKAPIVSLSFSKWSMKYLPDVKVMIPLINLHHHKIFSPYDFSQNLFIDLLDFLSQKCAEGKC